jgi:hypothetical protein
MIWFACKQCGKRHGRSESLIGTMVFCECGQGNRVPWSSTAAEPEPEEARPLPPRPRAPRPSLPEPADQGAQPTAGNSSERGPGDLPSPRRRRVVRRPNPAFCLVHDEEASTATCADCHCSFCSACVVTLQGQPLCGPCKNFRVRNLGRPPRMAALAIVAFVLALVGGPAAFFLAFAALGMQVSSEGGALASVVFCLLALALPSAGLVVSWLALRQTESRTDVGGRSLAMTGATTALVAILWSLTIAAIVIAKEVQG